MEKVTENLKRHRFAETSLLKALINRDVTNISRNRALVDKAVIPKMKLWETYRSPQSPEHPDGAWLKPSVFGIEFSEDGRMVISSHEDNSLRGFDSRTRKLVWDKDMAHAGCCNGSTFIDSNIFASYSDDTEVKIWDMRNLSRSLKSLRGHTDWVKNVSVVPGGKHLMTSGLDYTVRLFDINTPDEVIEAPPSLMLYGLCRTKLAPNGKTLVITTVKSTVYKIDNLDFNYLAEDVASYRTKPKTSRPFGKFRNNIEFLHYVPSRSLENYTGYSVDFSPDGLSCAIRHSSPRSSDEVITDFTAEWVAIYYMQKRQKGRHDDESEWDNSESELSDDDYSDLPHLHSNIGLNEEDTWTNIHQHAKRVEQMRSLKFVQTINNYLKRRSNIIRMRMSMVFSSWNDSVEYTGDKRIRPQNLRDASFFRKLDTQAEGIIKEAHFNSSGTLLVTPSHLGFQIMAFDQDLNSFVNSLTKDGCRTDGTMAGPTELTIIKDCEVYKDSSCVCAKFSPVENVVVAGDHKGRIMWFNP